MKYLAFLAGVLATVVASLPAHAQPGGREHSWRVERQQQRDFRNQREFRREEESQRRQQDQRANEGRPGRLTPEERQQLRRDIREHGRDVYHDRQRRF